MRILLTIVSLIFCSAVVACSDPSSQISSDGGISGKEVKNITFCSRNVQYEKVTNTVIKTFSSNNDVIQILRVLDNRKSTSSHPASISKYSIQIEYVDKSSKELLLWFGEDNENGTIMDLEEKGDLYTISWKDSNLLKKMMLQE